MLHIPVCHFVQKEDMSSKPQVLMKSYISISLQTPIFVPVWRVLNLNKKVHSKIMSIHLVKMTIYHYWSRNYGLILKRSKPQRNGSGDSLETARIITYWAWSKYQCPIKCNSTCIAGRKSFGNHTIHVST